MVNKRVFLCISHGCPNGVQKGVDVTWHPWSVPSPRFVNTAEKPGNRHAFTGLTPHGEVRLRARLSDDSGCHP